MIAPHLPTLPCHAPRDDRDRLAALGVLLRRACDTPPGPETSPFDDLLARLDRQ